MTRTLARQSARAGGRQRSTLAGTAFRAAVIATVVAGTALGVAGTAAAAAPETSGSSVNQAAADGTDPSGSDSTNADAPDGGPADGGPVDGGPADGVGAPDDGTDVDPAKADTISAQSMHTTRFRLTNATYSPLTVVGSHRSGVINERWRSGEEPKPGEVLKSPAIADFNIENTAGGDASGYVIYQIGDTPYRLKISAENPTLAPNKTTCSITDKNGSSVDSSKTGFKCENKTGSGIDMNADFVIEPVNAQTQVLTDYTDVTRREALEGMCTSDGQPDYSACDAAPINVTYKLGPTQVSSKVLINCSTSDSSKQVDVNETFGESTSIGTSRQTTLNLGDKLSVAVTKDYQQTWNHSVSHQESTNLIVKPGEYGYIESSVRMATITGDYTIKAGNQTFLIKNISLTAPANAKARTNVPLGADVPRSFSNDAGACDGANGTVVWKAKPTAINPGGSYTFGLNGANLLQVSDPGSSRANDTRLTLATQSGGRNQNWVLSPVEGSDLFQIRSDLTPRLCLDVLWGTGGSDVVQHLCKEATDSTIANQLWKPEYDPATESYKIVQPATGKLLTAGGGAVAGSQLSVATAPAANVSRWELFQVG